MTLRWKCLCMGVGVCVWADRLKKVSTSPFIFFCLSSLRRFVGTALQKQPEDFHHTTTVRPFNTEVLYLHPDWPSVKKKKKKYKWINPPPLQSPLWKSLWTLGTCRLSSMPNSWTHHRRNSLRRPDIKRPVEYSFKSFFFHTVFNKRGIVWQILEESPPPTPLWHLCRHLAGCFRSRSHNLLYCLRSKACPGYSPVKSL